MALVETVRGELRKEGVKLWLPPYTPPQDNALDTLAQVYASRLNAAEENILRELEELRQHAVAKLNAKTRITLQGRVLGSTSHKEVQLEAQSDHMGASVRAELCKLLGSAHARVIASGHALQDNQTLKDQEWQCDVERGGKALRVLVFASDSPPPTQGNGASLDTSPAGVDVHTPAAASSSASVPASTPASSPSAVAQIREAAEKLTATGFGDFELSDARTGQLISVPPAARQALIAAIALHARGREILSGNTDAASEALEFLVESDQCFQRSRDSGAQQIVDQLANFGELQLDICWAYALLGDSDQLSDAEARLEVAERMISRQVDKNFLTLAEVKADQGCTLPPEVLPSVRLWLLRGIARRCRGDARARADLERASLFMQALKVDEGALHNLLALGASRLQAVAALRRCGGSTDRAAVELLSSASQREAAGRQRKVQRQLGQTVDGSFVDQAKVDQLAGMGIDRKAAIQALKESNNDIDLAIDIAAANKIKDNAGGASGDMVDEVALASLLSLGFEQSQAEAALRLHKGSVEDAVVALTSGQPLTVPEDNPDHAQAKRRRQDASDETGVSGTESDSKAKDASDAEHAAMEEARQVVEQELGRCLRRNDMEDDVAGASLEQELMILHQHLSIL